MRGISTGVDATSSATHKVSDARGHHRPDPDNLPQPIHAPDYGRLSKGFGITHRYDLAAPPFGDGQDPEYLTALKQVRGHGIKPELMGITGRAVMTRLLGIILAALAVQFVIDGVEVLVK